MSSITDLPFGLAITIASGDSVLRTGVAATLSVAVANNTGASIALATGSAASAFAVYLPTPDLFTADQLRAITVTADSWTAAPLAPDLSINLTSTLPGTWADGQIITFTLANVTSSGLAGSGTVTLVPANLGADAPPGLSDSVTVAAPSNPGNLQLTDVLQVTLDNQGSVLRSPASADQLNNTLYLTLKNTGVTSLAVGGQQFGNPRVLVSFVYGNTSGALAPTTYDPAVGAQFGSAWKIASGISSAPLPWTAVDPSYVSQGPAPQWTLTPSASNTTLLGPAGTAQASAMFTFSNVVTFTPNGHTKMLVLCTGFARDATTRYDDHLFVLDIVKVDAPPTCGLLSFFGPDQVVPVFDPTSPITIPLRWSMSDVASVQLLSSSPTTAAQRKSYAVPPKPVDYDQSQVILPAPQASEAIFFTLKAFDAGGGYLNSQQFTAYAQISYVADTSGHVYPIALFGSTYWMLANYQLASAGSYDYSDNPANQAMFGRLYDATVTSQLPAGWQLPTVADWNALFGLYGSGKPTYAALVAGGRSGFNAQLGGQRVITATGSAMYEQQYQYGYYRAAGTFCAQFNSLTQLASAGTPVPDSRTAMSVRLVRYA